MNYSENSIPQAVIDSARTWLGTPFKLQGRLKGKGCDCFGLIMEISRELNIKNKYGVPLSNFDKTNYNLSTKYGKQLEEFLDKNLILKQTINSGDLILLAFDANPQHLGIISHCKNENFSVIHADITARKVVEHLLDDSLMKKIKKIYQFN